MRYTIHYMDEPNDCGGSEWIEADTVDEAEAIFRKQYAHIEADVQIFNIEDRAGNIVKDFPCDDTMERT